MKRGSTKAKRKPLAVEVQPVVRFEVGQIWKTSRGHLWHVVEIRNTGQSVLRLGGYGRKQFRTIPPSMWICKSNPAVTGPQGTVQGVVQPPNPI